ncbi:MAG: TonB-dependent receptor [Bacteroidota bacterium]|nr:TonB-dependent receptor [Bacteroidota bacterium]
MIKILMSWLLLVTIDTAMAIEPANTIAESNLSGTITDRNTGETLPRVSVYFPDLKTGTVSKSDGTYSISRLPSAKVLVQVSSTGYKLIAVSIDLKLVNRMDFALEPAITEISEVVVTGQSGGTEKNRTPAPVTTIPAIHLLENSASNIIDALASEPGISQVTTGVGISKPVIRGLGYNRVVVVNDGIRQEGQQWGDEHGIEIDEFSVSKVEILKGPASLAYGSDAMAGVINLISAPFLPEGTISGQIMSNFQTNNGLVGNSLNLAGNKNGFVWDLRASDKRAHAYKNKYDGPVYNSGFRENALSGIMGINRAWGFSHLHMSMYQLKPGIVEGERDSISGAFIKPATDGESMIPVSSSDYKSYSPEIPFQQIVHYKALIDNSIYLGEGNLKASLGFQQNHRKEFANSANPDEFELYFLLNTLNYNLRYSFPEINDYNLSVGVNGMWQQSENKGEEFLVPAYSLFDAGFFGILKKTAGDFDFVGGLRADQRSQQSEALFLNENGEKVGEGTANASERFAAFDKTFNGISGSLGASWQISKSVYTKLNVARGFRAPNISELGSNGVHEGTLRYEIGNPNLKPETSLQFDLTAGLNTQHVAAELNLFSNTVNHFIYSRKQTDTDGNQLLIDDMPAFLFTSGKANLKGGEFTLDIHPHPLDWLHIENSVSYVHATLQNQPDSSRFLPLTPPFHWTSVIKAEFENLSGPFKNLYVKVGTDWYAGQNNYFAAYGTETATPGYFLLNMGAGTDVVWGDKSRFSIYVSGNNLTDVAYQSHLSRLKYAETNNATGRNGIYNMGRNFSLKILIPIG